jgi:DNA-binding CsgD family transcriptional regulator
MAITATVPEPRGNYRALALHQIAALTTNARQIAKLLADGVSVAETGGRW